MYYCILNRETTELTGFFFSSFLLSSHSRQNLFCLSPSKRSETEAWEKKKIMLRAFSSSFSPSKQLWVKVSPQKHAELLSVSVSDSCTPAPLDPSVWFPPSPWWAVHLWPDEEKKKNNSWSSADSSVLRSEKSYSHSNGHISLHYISHSKRGINLSRPTEI